MKGETTVDEAPKTASKCTENQDVFQKPIICSSKLKPKNKAQKTYKFQTSNTTNKRLQLHDKNQRKHRIKELKIEHSKCCNDLIKGLKK